MRLYRRFKAYLALREAIRQADEKHLDGGGRFYVLPGSDGKLVVTDKKNFRILRRKHYINKEATIQDALNECFYFTPYKDGSGAISPLAIQVKRAQYLIWADAQHTIKKAKKKKRRLQ